jgi:hypothetical protein
MIVKPLRAPCGGTITVRAETQLEIDVRLEQLRKDHERGGPGCQVCNPPPRESGPHIA